MAENENGYDNEGGGGFSGDGNGAKNPSTVDVFDERNDPTHPASDIKKERREVEGSIGNTPLNREYISNAFQQSKGPISYLHRHYPEVRDNAFLVNADKTKGWLLGVLGHEASKQVRNEASKLLSEITGYGGTNTAWLYYKTNNLAGVGLMVDLLVTFTKEFANPRYVEMSKDTPEVFARRKLATAFDVNGAWQVANLVKSGGMDGMVKAISEKAIADYRASKPSNLNKKLEAKDHKMINAGIYANLKVMDKLFQQLRKEGAFTKTGTITIKTPPEGLEVTFDLTNESDQLKLLSTINLHGIDAKFIEPRLEAIATPVNTAQYKTKAIYNVLAEAGMTQAELTDLMNRLKGTANQNDIANIYGTIRLITESANKHLADYPDNSEALFVAKTLKTQINNIINAIPGETLSAAATEYYAKQIKQLSEIGKDNLTHEQKKQLELSQEKLLLSEQRKIIAKAIDELKKGDDNAQLEALRKIADAVGEISTQIPKYDAAKIIAQIANDLNREKVAQNIGALIANRAYKTNSLFQQDLPIEGQYTEGRKGVDSIKGNAVGLANVARNAFNSKNFSKTLILIGGLGLINLAFTALAGSAVHLVETNKSRRAPEKEIYRNKDTLNSDTNPLNPLAAGKNPQRDLADGILKTAETSPPTKPTNNAVYSMLPNVGPFVFDIATFVIKQVKYYVKASHHFLKTNHLASSLTHMGEINKEKVAEVSRETGEPYLIDGLSARTDNAPILGPSKANNPDQPPQNPLDQALKEAREVASFGSQNKATTPPTTPTTPPVGRTGNAKSL
jgi:hypothetical protein